MNKLAFVFPGQGAQAVGMGKDFCEQYDVARKLFAQADEALGYSIKDMCFDGPAEDLKLTANTQPVSGTELKVTGLRDQGEYEFRVAAKNAAAPRNHGHRRRRSAGSRP